MLLTVTGAWASDKVLLRDVEVLTLYHGRYTTGRRSSRVPQVKVIFDCIRYDTIRDAILTCARKPT